MHVFHILGSFAQSEILLVENQVPQSCILNTKFWLAEILLENAERITEFNHKIGIYFIMRNVMEFGKKKKWMNKSKLGL